MTAKRFHIGDLLSVSTGCLVSNDHIGGVYNILNHMTEDELYTHQLPLACDAMKPELLQQHPWLKDVAKPTQKLSTEADCVAYVASVANVHGEWHDIESAPLAWGAHDMLQDFHNQWPDKKVIVVDGGGCGMTTRHLAKYAAVTGAGSAATALFLDLTSILDYEAWEIALSFPLGAVAFLACWFLGEALVKDGAR